MHRILCLIVAAGIAFHARGGETDQFLTWGVELADSAQPVNEYLNREIQSFLATPEANEIALQSELASAIYYHFFKGLYASRIRNWLQHAPEVTRFPDKSVSWWDYQTESVYNRRTFPYVLPMSRTIRIGDVYTGIDKFGHFFGFGRRFYTQYARLRADGVSDEEARRQVVLRGVFWENWFVGKLVDGIFSPADIEAGYQGMLLCRDLASDSSGYITRSSDGTWVLKRPIDLRDYVTPSFDESYNTCHYGGLRKRLVIPALRERYLDEVRSPAVQERFQRYRTYPDSFCSQAIADHFEQRNSNPQREQCQAAFGLPHPAMAQGIQSTP